MKKLMTCLLAILMLLALTAQAETFKVGMECNYAPFNWTQAKASDFTVPLAAGGYADGYDVQVALFIAAELGLELEIVKTEWDGLPLALTSGKIDAIIAGMSPTAQRKATLDFSDPYYESDLVIVVNKGSQFASAESLSDFAGAKITGQLNTFHYSVIEQIPGVQKQTALDTFPAMIVALASGRIDGYVSERPGALSAVASNPDFAFVSFEEGLGFEASEEDTAVAVGLRKESPLMGSINTALAKLDKETRIRLMDEAMARQPLSE
ncbi:MAG: transporter substrate-binding domain-containing protein [Eubacteriales bacterium]|jgi:putative lysine transport system substrate-binding protein|nr:transporter substrate-binding domain-containing protein [Eubacteriales bacterium]MDD3571587.1 transporter substrate-binding domain-containing protein [Eubacteriales bacterium]MDD4133649.1 transporter substrate-binding domain-containing protein [Eubacteriales bacterium]